MINNPIWKDLRTGVKDANAQDRFFSILLKGLLYNLNRNLKVRGLEIPHFILNTGDDIMYLEVKGQDHSVEPLEVSNESFVYNTIPRCMVTPGGINILSDQLTSPYTHGTFQFDYEGTLYNFTAEYRRIPLRLTVATKYILDNFTDTLELTQQIISHRAFINKFSVIYLGQTINCSYNIPEDYNTEFQVEFDGGTTDSKNRTLEVELAVETNYPVIYPDTIMPSDAYIKTMKLEINTPSDHETKVW